MKRVIGVSGRAYERLATAVPLSATSSEFLPDEKDLLLTVKAAWRGTRSGSWTEPVPRPPR